MTAVRRVLGAQLAVGDVIGFDDRYYEITEFAPYEGIGTQFAGPGRIATLDDGNEITVFDTDTFDVSDRPVQS